MSIIMPSGTIELSACSGTVVESAAELIEQVFPDVVNNYTDHNWIRGRRFYAR